ncbi:hypothetical protein B0O99DRAFT_498383 [Bisporella sp. PMI_857]|nr:hypothetical protein B0O99DRAFT_498383 [Bisporella sp. PMI_857]
MNQESPASLSSGPPPNQRKERGAIAAQACDTCRSRKQKCDEQRPKCGLCQRMKLECRYREPQPTKKDKTLVEILDRLTSLEGKVDRLPTTHNAGFGPPQPSPMSQPSFSTSTEDDPSSYSSPASYRTSQQPSSSGRPVGIAQPYRHSAAAHRMLIWPAIQQLLLQSVSPSIADMKILEQEGTSFMISIHRGMPNLPMDDFVPDRNFVGMQSQAARSAGGQRVTFPTLNRAEMHRLATSYFDTFNLIYPFMDRQTFLLETLARVHSEGFDGDTDSVIALLVFALGELAIESAAGPPIEVYNGRPSGVKGGTATKPPGLAYFNEARKRMGFVVTHCDLETVQIFSLAANPIEWNSQRGDLIKRSFWHCAIMETGLYLELDLPPTGLIELEEHIGLPSFNGPYCEADHRGNQSSHFEAHFASQVALRRLCAIIHQTLSNSNEKLAPSTTGSQSNFSAPPLESMKELGSQLDQWRTLLPQNLQWAEDHPEDFPSPQTRSTRRFEEPVDPNLQAPTGHPLFTSDLSADYIRYPYVYDVQVALLRTRYYYAKYMLYRPYVYKALHFPNTMAREDYDGAAECLRCCLKWPLALSPASRRKRMIPYLFCWSQNFLSILIIIHLTTHNEVLRNIRTQLCGPRFESEIGATVDTMIDWIRDLKSSDPISLWCWKILKGIYRLE